MDQVNGNDCQEEIIYSRILFLLTYQTRFDFDLLFDNYHLIESIHAVCQWLSLFSISHNFGRTLTRMLHDFRGMTCQTSTQTP